MKPFQETNYIAKDKENEQWKSSLPPEEVKEKMLAQRGFTQGNTAQRASGDFARHLLANFPSEPVSYLPARILRAYFPRYFGKILENPQRIFSVFPFISQKI